MPFPIPRRRSVRATTALLISGLLSLWAPAAAPAGGLARLEVTQTSLTPDFSPATAAYTAELLNSAAAMAVHTLPDSASSRLFLQAANSPWQQVARGATIAGGADHSVVLRNDGTVVAWGDNSRGQTTVPSAAQTGVTALAAGANHTLALAENGAVIAWGDDSFGQCLVPVEAQSGIVAIAAGGNQSLALTAEGAVIAWGDGAGALPGHAGSGVVAIAAGNNHGLALTSAGAVVAWGVAPAAPPAATADVVAIAAGGARSLALRRDGTVLAWGYDSEYLQAVPAAAQGAAALAAGLNQNIVLRADGSVFAWGFGPGPHESPVSATSDVVAIAAGESHALALKRDGSLVTWGTTRFNLDQPPLPARNSLRLPASAALPLGYGTNRLAVRAAPVVAPAAAPVPLASLRTRVLSTGSFSGALVLRVDGTPAHWGGYPALPAPLPTGLVAVSNGESHALAIKSDGSLLTWGYPDVLILAPASATDLAAVSAAPDHSLALRRDGQVVAWGRAPSALLNVPAAAQSGVVAIFARYNFNLALRADGSVVQWGSSLPAPSVPVEAQSDVVAIAASAQHAFALKANGSLVAWGPTGNPLIDSIPSDAADLIAISASTAHALALRSDGRVVAWGENNSGQCNVPAEAQSGVVTIAAGNNFSLAIKTDGSLVAWGNPGTIPPEAQSGLLLPPSASSIQITSASDLLAPRVPLAAGEGFNVALRDTGAPVAWPSFSAPTAPADLSGLVALAARGNYVLGLRASGAVVAWASSYSTPPTLTLPAAAQSGGVALAAGVSHALALKTDGSVIAWGSNSSGQCNVPELNPGTTASNGYFFTAVAASESASFGLRSDGRVVAWGSSSYGLTTVPAAAQSDVVAIAAGQRHALALKRDGSVVGWGDSYGGANASFTPSVPVVALAAGESFSLYLHADGTVSGVGSNNFYVPANASADVVAITASRMHASVLKADGSVVSWGNFSAPTPSPLTVLRPGPPGDDYRVTVTRAYPDPALSALRVGTAPLDPAFAPTTTLYTQAVIGDSDTFGLALKTAGATATVQVRVNGAPPQTSLASPAFLLSPTGSDVLGLDPWGGFATTSSYYDSEPNNVPAATREGLIGIAYVGGQLVGLTRAGGILCWYPGNNTLGQVPAVLARDVVQLTACDNAVLILLGDGSVREWNPTGASFNWVPSELSAGVVRIASRGSTRLALLDDGSVRSWGNIPAPPAAAASDVVSIHAGDGVAFARKTDGTVLLWGNHSPALADIPPALSAGFTSLVADHDTAQALLVDGSVISWGEALPNLTPPPAARSGVVALAAFGAYRAAQKRDGTIVYWNTQYSQTGSATLPLASPREFPLTLRQGANRVTLRVTPLGRPLSAAPIATGYYRHYAVSPAGAVVFRNASTSSSGTSLPNEALSGIASVFSGGHGDFALTTAGRIVSLNNSSLPPEAQPTAPGQTPMRAPVASLAVGNNVTVLLRTDGSTYQWGSMAPIPADAQTGVAAIAVGDNFALALRRDGRVVGWGYNSTALAIPGAALSDVVAIAASYNVGLALKADGSVVRWGGYWSQALPPAAQSGVAAIALNESQALALKTDGSVIAWGPDALQYPPPAAVSSGVIGLFAAGRHQIALKADGSTVTWGRHMSGGPLYDASFGVPLLSAPVRDYHLTVNLTTPPQLRFLGSSAGALAPTFAPNTTAYALPSTPYPALTLPALSARPGDELALRVGDGTFQTRAAGPVLAASLGSLLALRPDGTVRAFSGDSVGSVPTAAQSGVTALAAGTTHAFALKRDGSIVAWGQDYNSVLTGAPTGSGYLAVASGTGHGLAILPSGAVSAWGGNSAYQTLVPVAATDCVAIAAGEYTSMALRRDGAVVAWGRYTSAPQTIPTDTQSGVVAIAAGREHYLALRADGRVVQWGNTSGFSDVPPVRFVAIAACGNQNLGLRPNGELVTWGGYSGPFLSVTPANSTGIVAIAAGPSFAAALRADGSLVTIPASSSGFSQLNGTPSFAGPFALPLHATLPLALGDNTVELRVSRPDSGLPPATYSVAITRNPAPGFRLVSGADLATGNPWLHNFGLQRLGVASPAALLTLANPGTADLVILTASLSGTAAGDFALSGLSLPLTLPPGASTTFTATVTPAATGVRFASLLLGANLPDDEPAGFAFRAEGVSYAGDLAYWRSTQFLSGELADPALEATLWGDLADPDADGIPNLLEYATGTDAEIANTAPLPVALDATAPGGPRLTYTYQRRVRAAVGGLAFRIEWSDTLATGSWSAEGVTETVTATQGSNETVVASVPAGASRRFLRLRVTAP